MDDDTIEQRIESLKIDLDDLGVKIVQQVKAVHSSIIPDFNVDLKDDPRNCIKSLRFDINDILKIAAERSDQIEQYAADLNRCNYLISMLEVVNIAGDLLCKFDDSISQDNLKRTCTLLDQVVTAVSNLPSSNSEYGVGSCITALRQEADILKSRFISKLKRLIDCHIQFKVGTLQVTPLLKANGYSIPGESEKLSADDSMQDHGTSLIDCWEALLHVQAAADVMNTLCRQLWTSVILPLWSERNTSTSTTNAHGKMQPLIMITKEYDAKRQQLLCLTLASLSTKQNSSISSSVSSMNPHSSSSGLGVVSGEVGACKAPFPLLLDSLSMVIQFVANELLCNSKELTALAHQCLFLHKPIALGRTLVTALTSLIPESEHQLDSFQRSVEQPCRDFEDKCVAVGLPCVVPIVSSGNSANASQSALSHHPLTAVVSELRNKYCANRRQVYLTRARELLLSDYHNTMYGTGDALEDDVASAGNIGNTAAMLEHSGAAAMQALSFECCQVSLAAWRTLRLCHDILREACLQSSSEHSTHILFQCARDCIELFMTIVPVKFGELLDTVPRMGAVFYNDCSYLAHNCTLMTFRYRKEFTSTILKENVGFVDFIPRLRTLGQKYLAKHMELQKSLLLESMSMIHLSPVEHGSSSSGGLSGRNTPAAVNNDEGAVQTMHQLELLRGQWYRVLPDNVYERMMGYLAECIIRVAVYPVQNTDVIAATAATDIGRIYRLISHCKDILIDTQDENVLRMIPSYHKFTVLTELLDFSISEVMEWLPRKKFASFTSAELSALVKALFDDSERRKSILNLILELTK